MTSTSGEEDSMNVKQYKQRLCLNLSEMDSDQRPWRSAIIFCSVVLLSILANICRRQFTLSVETLLPQNSNFSDLTWSHIVAAVLETVCLAACTRFQNVKSDVSYREATALFLVAHTGYVMVLGYTTMLKEQELHNISVYCEPLIVIGVVLAITRKTTDVSTLGVSLVSSLGAVIMMLSLQSVMNLNNTAFLTILLAICASARNLCCKLMYHEQAAVVLHRRFAIAFIAIGATVPICAGSLLGRVWIKPVIFIVMACVMSVMATFLICNTFLKNMSISSVAFVNLWMKILYDAFFLSSLYRPSLLTSVIGLTIVIVSHLLYTKKQLEYSGTNINFKLVSTDEFYIRLQFLLFAAGVGSLFFYALTPRLSERDLHVLSYVGLDRAARRLLQQNPPIIHN